MRNPHFGAHGWPGARGDDARPAPRRRPLPAREPTRALHHCPQCGRPVRWDSDRQGRTIAVEAGRVHVCELDEVLERQSHEDGAEILATLRRAINERRMYGAAV